MLEGAEIDRPYLGSDSDRRIPQTIVGAGPIYFYPKGYEINFSTT